MVSFAPAKGTQVEAVLFVEGGTLRGGIRASDVPVDANNVVVGSGEAETRVAFRPCDLSVGKFGGSGGLEMEENGVSPTCADKADGGGGRLAAA